MLKKTAAAAIALLLCLLACACTSKLGVGLEGSTWVIDKTSGDDDGYTAEELDMVKMEFGDGSVLLTDDGYTDECDYYLDDKGNLIIRYDEDNPTECLFMKLEDDAIVFSMQGTDYYLKKQ